MGELDYQMALILQHRLEQEYKNAEQSDFELARQLQEQFEQEEAVEKPSSSLAYHQPKKGLNSSKCLTDPSWELVDPTPDIHNLFIAFDQRFFWNKLQAVCVSWSKKMTSCAGICSYSGRGRGGLCSITLSEPLLKLRPRKDLVETLLHEMIHAFLFVTNNNKDRDGHGPEFHKHMYRINKEAGTNITVYHDFHDEVRLYQQHWWRCNGPCQRRKPYFGMVRRATNRAPGPNDRWWAEHSRNCGGTFIKVREPEKTKKQGKKTESKPVVSSVKSKDIRTFVSVQTAGTSNVKGFKDLTVNVKGKFNSSTTIVVSTNSKTSTESTFKPTIFNAGTSKKTETKTTKGKTSSARTSGTLNKKTSSTSTKENNNSPVTKTSQCTDDFLSVRNHWAKKFPSNIKRPQTEESKTVHKVLKVSNSSEIISNKEESCECPVCNKKVLMSELNQHLDICLKSEEMKNEIKTEIVDLSDSFHSEETKECPLCNKQIPTSTFDTHVEKCLMQVYDGVEELASPKEQEKVSCLACGKKIIKSELNSHLEECMIDIFDEEFDENTEKKEEKVLEKNDSEFNCPFCLKLVEEEGMKEHLDGCLKCDDVTEAFIDDNF